MSEEQSLLPEVGQPPAPSYVLHDHNLGYFPELRVGEEIFTYRFAGNCSMNSCSAQCCRYGVLVDIEHRDRILSEAALVLSYMEPFQEHDPARWFEPAAFVLQPAGFYGDVARNALIGPGFASIDFSLSKTFPLFSDSRQLEFRADLFNLLNHPNFATPSSSTGAQIVGGVIVFPDASGAPAGSAGQIFRTVNDARQIQFSLRYRF